MSIPCNRVTDCAFSGIRETSNHGEVVFFYPSLGKLPGEKGKAFRVFCRRDYTGGIFIESVYNTGSYFLIGKTLLEGFHMIEQPLHEGAAKVPRGGVHHHSRRLVYYHNRCVFIENIQRYLLRFNTLRGKRFIAYLQNGAVLYRF